MKRIAIIGASEFQDPLIRKAKEMGFETHVFAWAADDVGEHTADIFHPISIVEKEAIWDVCKELGVVACCSIGSDLAIHTVNYVQRKLGIPCNPELTDTIATNKFEMRKAFRDAGIPCPGFLQTQEIPRQEALAGLTYPMIVKPTDRSGSRGIFQIETYEQLCEAVPQSIACSFDGTAIIEELIDGPEYSCESISFAGTHHILAFTKKYTTGAPHFIETGHCEPSDIPDDVLEKVSRQVCAALDALQIQYGAGHTEFKLGPQEDIRIIEIGSRMGGDCIGSDLVYLSTGMDYMAMVIDVACGKPPDLTPVGKPQQAEIRFIFSETDLKDLQKVQQEAPETIWRSVCGTRDLSEQVTDSSNRHGYWITVSDIEIPSVK